MDGKTLHGGCLCGRTRYEATPASDEGYYCHCRMCQLAVGNTRAVFFNLPKKAMRWTAEPPRFYASSSFAKRGFCRECGTPLSFEYLNSENIDLTVGSLDEPRALKPSSHFAIETRVAAWHVPDGLPEQRLDEHQSLMKRWREAYGNSVKPGLDAVRGQPEA